MRGSSTIPRPYIRNHVVKRNVHNMCIMDKLKICTGMASLSVGFQSMDLTVGGFQAHM